MSENQKYRLITRADFDGVVCGGLLYERDMVDDVVFVEPKDVQEGRVPVTGSDITANLPYVSSVHMCYDHHVSEMRRVGDGQSNHVIDPESPSAARVIWKHFGGKKAFPLISEEMMDAVDKADSAQYTEEEILAPQRWTLLNFIMDPRSGLSRFGDFRLSNDELMKALMIYCRHTPIDEILIHPDVVERVHRYIEHDEKAEMQIRRCARVFEDVVVVDFRHETLIYAANRFLVYALYPEARVSVFLVPEDGGDGTRTTFAIGKSIIDRSSLVNVGMLALEYGGGGHKGAGTCRVPNERVDQALNEIIGRIVAAG